ncbi:MAG: 2-oxoglutarate dehydrogenase E1 component [Gammaproteobacteria bacterium]|nr:2-oxoglutarate dehydrogenase E1 component [Gammaproteobacteria bacterium]
MKTLTERSKTTPLYGGSAPFVESLYESWLADRGSVSETWRRYFEENGNASDRPRGPVEDELEARAHATRLRDSGGGSLDGAAQRLIDAWRLRGHLIADTDPLGMKLDRNKPPRVDELEASSHGLRDADFDREVKTDWAGEVSRHGLGELLHELRDIYGGHVTAEFSHVSDPEQWRWLAKHIEGPELYTRYSAADRRRLLAGLTAAEGLEKYLHRRYVGQKRFSLEGADTLIPMLNDLIRRANEDAVREVVIGMAHRGRLNVLVNVLGKSPSELFSEFEGSYEARGQSDTGDVKYHLGFSSDVEIDGRHTHLVLAFNPSHLEAVDPVVEGSVRARQDRAEDPRGERVLPVLIHGDASLVGQGVVMETLQMSATRGFGTGGTVHIVVNNQIGFTISNLDDARSSRYCTDIAKMIEAPVLRVNGDDPEKAVSALRLAFAFRQRFGKDVFVDLVCYRRHGHNEADEPAVTQPLMYEVIRKHPTTRELYAQRLEKEGVIDAGKAGAMVDQYDDGLDTGKVVDESTLEHERSDIRKSGWGVFDGQSWEQEVDTGVAIEKLRELGAGLTRLPEGFKAHSRAQRVLGERGKMIAGESPIDWGCAENLAYASLVTSGYPVRLTGQDTVRGTFFHRHATFADAAGKEWTPLNHLADDQAPFMVYDSLLSEEAVIGFEYGYATTRAEALTLWEAQYGDFANNAQVMFDQFISSGEAKWARLCGLVLLLPHGYEGAGPEHSSARLERFLQLCAQNNMQVCVPSNAAQIFHLLRRQMLRPFRAPLAVMTPKSLLRHKLAATSLEELSDGSFRLVIPEVAQRDPKQVKRVVFCSGKVYYELVMRREKEDDGTSAIVRIEQLYPFPREAYAAELNLYRDAREIVWCQEEPENQGAWYQIRHRLQESLNRRQTLVYAGRVASAAPATGYAKQHRAEEDALVEEALGLGEQAGLQGKVKKMESK